MKNFKKCLIAIWAMPLSAALAGCWGGGGSAPAAPESVIADSDTGRAAPGWSSVPTAMSYDLSLRRRDRLNPPGDDRIPTDFRTNPWYRGIHMRQ